jgi:hypothetical protein
VRAGDVVTVALTLSATNGKLRTVYRVGAPVPGSTFSVQNSCPDGAPTVSESARAALRMQMFGTGV